MSGEKKDPALGSIEKKIDKIADELASVKKDLSVLSSVKGIDKKVESLEKDLKDVQSHVSPISDLIKSVEGMDSDIGEIKDSKEMAVLFKKMDDILVGVSELGNESGSQEGSAVISKKIDELQQYVAGLSDLEEAVQEVSGSLTETKEIVGIIVRQLDDIERKYNLAIDKIEEALETLTSLPSQTDTDESEERPTDKPAKKTPKKTVKERAEEEKEAPVKVSKSTIDEIMKGLLQEVTPQTEAREMAKALEEVRDRLTSMISGHTPVLFQFGKKARELKSYPPTATLNENDIANLNTEIRSWTSKLKEIAKSD